MQIGHVCLLSAEICGGLFLEEEEAGVCRVEGSKVYFADCLANSLHDTDLINALLGFIDGAENHVLSLTMF